MNLEERVDELTAGWSLNKKRMFSGFGYMINDNLAFGTHKKDELIIRAGEDKAEQLLKQPGIRVFDMTGRPMKNWLMANEKAFKTDEDLLKLLKIGKDFAESLPPKK